MGFFRSKIPPSSFSERLPVYLQLRRQKSSSPIVLERLENDENAAATVDEVSDVLARSFAGRHGTSQPEAMYDFAMGPEFPLSDPKCEAKRVEFVRFYMKWSVISCLEYGVVLLARERDGDGGDGGRVLGAVCALPPENGHVADTTKILRPHFFKILSGMGWQPPPDVLGKDPTRRMGDVIGKALKKLHEPAQAHSASRNGGTPPWYVYVLGADVDAQGMGCGTALLEAVHSLADSDGVDTMLEYTGEKKRVFYCEKMGYENFGGEVTLSDPKSGDRSLDVAGIAAIRPKRQPKLPSM